jgi:hypothetical protein
MVAQASLPNFKLSYDGREDEDSRSPFCREDDDDGGSGQSSQSSYDGRREDEDGPVRVLFVKTTTMAVLVMAALFPVFTRFSYYDGPEVEDDVCNRFRRIGQSFRLTGRPRFERMHRRRPSCRPRTGAKRWSTSIVIYKKRPTDMAPFGSPL